MRRPGNLKFRFKVGVRGSNYLELNVQNFTQRVSSVDAVSSRVGEEILIRPLELV